MQSRTLIASCLLLLATVAGGVAWFLLSSGSGALAVEAGSSPHSDAARGAGEDVAIELVEPGARNRTDNLRELAQAAQPAEADPSVPPKRPRPVPTIPMEPTPRTSIQGSVRTLAGIGLEEILVSAAPLERAAAPKVWTRTDPQGQFKLAVPDDPEVDYRIQVVGAPRDTALGNLIRTLKQQGELHREGIFPGSSEVDFAIPASGTADLIVVDSRTGHTVSFCTLDWAPSDSEEFRPYGVGVRFLNHADDGRIHVGLPAGELLLRISAPGYASKTVEVAVIPHAHSHPFLIELQAQAVVQLHIVEETLPELDESLPLFLRAPQRRPFARTLFLMTPEEFEQADDIDGFYVANRALLNSNGRLFEAERDGSLLAFPGQGSFHLAIFPSGWSVEPDTITVPVEGLEVDIKTRLEAEEAFEFEEF